MNNKRRFEKILRDGNLTVADLARWLKKPYATVNGWVKGGNIGGPIGDREFISHELNRIESMLKKRKQLPIVGMSRAQRASYLEKLAAN